MSPDSSKPHDSGSRDDYYVARIRYWDREVEAAARVVYPGLHSLEVRVTKTCDQLGGPVAVRLYMAGPGDLVEPPKVGVWSVLCPILAESITRITVPGAVPGQRVVDVILRLGSRSLRDGAGWYWASQAAIAGAVLTRFSDVTLPPWRCYKDDTDGEDGWVIRMDGYFEFGAVRLRLDEAPRRDEDA